MGVAYTLAAESDADFAREWITPVLVASGLSVTTAVAEADVVVVVVSQAAASASGLRAETAAALERTRTTVLPVLRDDTGPGSIHERLGDLLYADFREPGREAQRDLANILPSTRHEAAPPAGVWDAAHFTQELKSDLAAFQYKRAADLVEAVASYLGTGVDYPPVAALADMKALQGSRYFRLEAQLGEALVGAGVDDPSVRRRYGQALIETRDYDKAESELSGLIAAVPHAHPEWGEAMGLLGRVHKQLYFDALDSGGPPDRSRLTLSIEMYHRAYLANPAQLFWQGINAATLLQRAERDGVPIDGYPHPQMIAAAILATLDNRAATDSLESWDLATYAEAYVARHDLVTARTWLDKYVGNAGTDAFALGSTYRQFDQVMEVGNRSATEGGRLLDILLSNLVARRGGISLVPPGHRSRPAGEQAAIRHPLLIRVVDPGWKLPARAKAFVTLGTEVGTIHTAAATDRGLQVLMHDPEVLGLERSRPSALVDATSSLPFVHGDVLHTGAGGLTERGDQALVAIIDGGIDVLHEAFLDGDSTTRIVSIWNQHDHSGDPPQGFDHGTEYTQTAIQGFRAHPNTIPVMLGRDFNSGHGTHVASIAAGRATGAGGFAGGMAPEAKIVIVIPSTEDEKIGYSRGHTEALAYIEKVATTLGLPVVVNVSQGQNAGAHDGKSKLEVAFDDFAGGGRTPGRIVVKSAGNERGQDGHAKVPLGQESAEELKWESDNQIRPHDELQFWFDSADECRFRLKDPGGENSEWVAADGCTEGNFTNSGNRYELQSFARHEDNGDSLLLVRIALGDAKSIQTGIWSIEIESGEVKGKGVIHAWIERDNRRPLRFVNHQNEEMTLSIPGTADSVITVGAVRLGKPFGPADFSSYGPTRDKRDKPDVAAPGVGIWAARAGSAAKAVTMDGTSMAAPHVTGAIALLLSHLEKQEAKAQVNANQVAKALQQKAQNFTGIWKTDQGYGVLDAAALLKAF